MTSPINNDCKCYEKEPLGSVALYNHSSDIWKYYAPEGPFRIVDGHALDAQNDAIARFASNAAAAEMLTASGFRHEENCVWTRISK